MESQETKIENPASNESMVSAWQCHPMVMKTPRTLHQAVAIDDHRIVISGGIDDQFQTLKSAEMYDFWTNEVTPLPNFSVDRYSHSSVVCDEQVFVMGGCSNSSRINVGGDTNKTLNTVEFFNMKESTRNGTKRNREQKWIRVADMITSRFDFASCATKDNKYIYIFGGKSTSNHSTNLKNNHLNPDEEIKILSSVERYDVVNDKWEKVAPMRYAMAGHIAITVGENMYVFGGITNSDNNHADCLKVEIYNIVSQRWICCPTLPFAFFNLVAVVPYGIWIILIGGQHLRSSRNSYLFFNTVTMDWHLNQKINDLIIPRNEHSQVILNEKILLVFGGLNKKGKILKSIEYSNIQDFVADEIDGLLLTEGNIDNVQTLESRDEDSCLNISIEASLKEIELSLLITELEDDFHEAFVHLGGECGEIWLQNEEFQKSLSEIIQDNELVIEGKNKEINVSNNIPNNDTEERNTIVQELCPHWANSKGFAHNEWSQVLEDEEKIMSHSQENLRMDESTQPELEGLSSNMESNCESPLHFLEEKKSSNVMIEPIPYSFNDELSGDRTNIIMLKFLLLGFLLFVLVGETDMTGMVWGGKAQLNSITNEQIELAKTPIQIFTSKEETRFVVRNSLAFEIGGSVLTCALHTKSHLTYDKNEFRINQKILEHKTKLLGGVNWIQRRKIIGTKGHRIRLSSNCNDVNHIDVEMVIVNNQGLTTLGNSIQPVHSGDIKISLLNTTLQSHGDELVHPANTIAEILVNVKNDVVNIVNPTRTLTIVDTKNSFKHPEISNNENEGTNQGTDNKEAKLRILRIDMHFNERLFIKAATPSWIPTSTKSLWRFYERLCSSVVEGILGNKEKLNFLFHSLFGLRNIDFSQQISISNTSIARRLQLLSVLHSESIRNILKRSSILTFLKLSTEQSIQSVEDMCDALATRRFNLLLTRDYLHQWRGNAKPRILKQRLKPLCNCVKKKSSHQRRCVY